MLDLSDPLMFLFFVCAVFGGATLLLQMILMSIGFGGGEIADSEGGDPGDTGDTGDSGPGDSDTDTEGPHHASGHVATDVFKMLSIRTVVAGLTFFGLGGLGGLTGGLGHALSLLLAVACGSIAIYIVYYLYMSIARLNYDGSISTKTLVGAFGNVYLRIPEAGRGAGKVLVSQQERTMEYEAITAGEELKSGTPIVVVRIVSPTTVEVKACN